ncbi:MAG: choice-of-anchor D domain-containing protein [Myxococcales bacterium]
MELRWIAALATLASLCGCGRTDPLVERQTAATDGSVAVCDLEITPDSVDFGDVPLGTQFTRTLSVRNVSRAHCDVARMEIGEGSDSEFSLLFPPPTPFVLVPGQTRHVSVAFDARSRDLPRERLGSVTFVTTAIEALVSVPLRARILIGCDLSITPALMDFGTVRLNKSAAASVMLANQGDAPCDVSNLALAPGSDRLFSVPADQATAFTVPPGGLVPLNGAFSARDSTEPHERTGTLAFTRSQPSGLPLTPTVELTVPMKAFIDTACLDGSQWIYTVAQDGRFATFNPQKLEYTDIGTLSCPGYGSPFSMAVDQNAVAWVEFNDGGLYQVDTKTAACSATSFVSNPKVTNFGMGFVYDPDTGIDTLFVAGGYGWGQIPSTLASISFPSLQTTVVGEIDFGAPELTGTGDGELWGYAPAFISASGITTLAHIDQKSGRVLASREYPQISEANGSWALAFWGGSFWLFLGDSIYEVKRNTLEARQVLSFTGRHVVGVGVSTCAPLD